MNSLIEKAAKSVPKNPGLDGFTDKFSRPLKMN
jgi:hypothetical protein